MKKIRTASLLLLMVLGTGLVLIAPRCRKSGSVIAAIIMYGIRVNAMDSPATV